MNPLTSETLLFPTRDGNWRARVSVGRATVLTRSYPTVDQAMRHAAMIVSLYCALPEAADLEAVYG